MHIVNPEGEKGKAAVWRICRKGRTYYSCTGICPKKELLAVSSRRKSVHRECKIYEKTSTLLAPEMHVHMENGSFCAWLKCIWHWPTMWQRLVANGKLDNCYAALPLIKLASLSSF